jgi:DNA topoisomerase VI subunit A
MQQTIQLIEKIKAKVKQDALNESKEIFYTPEFVFEMIQEIHQSILENQNQTSK